MGRVTTPVTKRVTKGQLAVLALVVPAVVVGAGIYYTQVYGYYDRLEPQIGYAIATPEGVANLSIAGFEGIDSDSSPLRYRACFTITGALPELVDYTEAEPLISPSWFDCFDAATIAADLEAGTARAVLVEQNAPYGFDHVMALYPDGHAYVWPQLNACGAALFDDDPLPVHCPPPPES